MRIRSLGLLLLTGALALALTASASAATYNVAVGIGDQSPQIFANPRFKALKVKKVRYFIRWDAIRHRADLAEADAYVAAARRANVKVLMHISTNDLRNKVGRLPSLKSYKRDVGRLVDRYKAKGVKDWGVWNEANHKSQETWNHPGSAAKFFLAMRQMCRGCTIVALDILDQPGATRYVSRWFDALGRRNRSKVKVVGIHNYSDTNRFRSSGTRDIIRSVKRYARGADFWLTETGGVAAFGKNFRCDFDRQARATKYMFALTKKYRRDITRLYSYNFFGTSPQQCRAGSFDAGLVEADGTPRKAYATFLSQAKSFSR